MAIHEIPLERRTLHGHFSRDLDPILTVDSGDAIAFSCLSSGWVSASGEEFQPRDEELDAGHALVGPVEVRGAQPGRTLEVRIDELRIGPWGLTLAGGWPTPLNERLGLADGEPVRLDWELDPDAGLGRTAGWEVALGPFLGVVGMPPAEPGVHSTGATSRVRRKHRLQCSSSCDASTGSNGARRWRSRAWSSISA